MDHERRPLKLLVSVRSAEEGRAAIDGGADWIDVKEPLRGSLGAADDRTLREVAAVVGRQRPLSAALGELHQWPSSQFPESLATYDFAKLGLSKCGNTCDWQDRWSRALESMPPTVQRVAVAYADWTLAGAPRPEHVLRAARQFNCTAALLDTYCKGNSTLFDHYSVGQLRDWIELVKESGMMCVIAGSLSECLMETLMPLGPDMVAVRGAVCRGNRAAAVDLNLVSKLANLIRGKCAKQTSIA